MSEEKDVVLPDYLNDMRDISEDGRIAAIGEAASERSVTVLLEKDQPEKIARYIKRVTEQFPGVEHLGTYDSVVPSIVALKFGRKSPARIDMTIPADFPAPTYDGAVAKIWDITEARRAEFPGEEDATLRMWYIFAPWMHPAWSWHVAAIVHLRGEIHGKPAHIKIPGATHEFMVYALNPDAPVTTKKLSYLTPVSIVQQFIAESDALALEKIEKHFPAILAGALSVDSDFRNAWRILLTENN